MKKIILLLFIFASLFTFATKKPVPSMDLPAGIYHLLIISQAQGLNRIIIIAR